MRIGVILSATAAFSIASCLTCLLYSSRASIPVVYAETSAKGDSPRQIASVENPCAAPNRITGSLEETAWRIWVAATCPVNQNQYPYVVWENWLEQSQMFPDDPQNGLKVPNAGPQAIPVPPHPLHASPLALVKNPSLTSVIPGLLGGADQNCNKAGAAPPDQPNLQICEEVRENGSTEDYIAGTGMWQRSGQQYLAQHATNIQFPRPSVEIKSDWVLLTSVGLDCANLPPELKRGVHVEVINGNCYALAGMHLISKLVDQWIWATFEPQNRITNPNRCKVLGCMDNFGSRPASSTGAPTYVSKRLSDLMDAANLAPEWKNYRLDGVQVHFTRNGQPTLLGNSVIEGENAGVPLDQSSCITCHALSSVKKDGSDGITLLQNFPGFPVGDPEPLPSADWIRRDFVWSLFLACPGRNGCSTTPPIR